MISKPCDETFSVLSPTHSGEHKSFSFVSYTFGSDARSRKTIRSQAARSSARARIQTIADRHYAQEPKPKRIKSSVHLDTTNTYNDDSALLSSLTEFSNDKWRSKSVPTPSVTECVNDWKCRLPSFIQQAFHQAVKALHQYYPSYDISSLVGSLVKSSLYNDPLMLKCLELLIIPPATTVSTKDQCQRWTAAFLRHRLIVAVQAEIRGWQGTNWALTPVMLLLAGWEIEHGDERAARFHLQAMCILAPSKITSSPVLKMPETFPIPALPAPVFLRSIPTGFEFFKSNNLLPPCLMNLTGSLKHFDPTLPAHSIQIRRFGLAAMACRPSDTESFQALWDDEVAVLVALHVRLAAGLLSNIMLLGTTDGLSGSQAELLTTMYSQTTSLNSDLAVGSMYDGILLWSLCIFCASTLEPTSPQLNTIQKILQANGIQTWAELESLLERYIYPEGLASRLRSTLGHILE